MIVRLIRRRSKPERDLEKKRKQQQQQLIQDSGVELDAAAWGARTESSSGIHVDAKDQEVMTQTRRLDKCPACQSHIVIVSDKDGRYLKLEKHLPPNLE